MKNYKSNHGRVLYTHSLQHDGGNQSGAVTLCTSFYNDSGWRTAYGQDALYSESFEAESRASIITKISAVIILVSVMPMNGSR